MKNLEESIKYTAEKKQEQLSDIKFYYDDNINNLKSYLGATNLEEIEDKEYDAESAFRVLERWYLWGFLDLYIQKKQVDYDKLYLSCVYGVIYAKWIDFVIVITKFKYPKGRYNFPFGEASLTLSKLLFLGKKEETIDLGNIILKNVEKDTRKDFNDSDFPVFIMELFAKWHKKEIVLREYDKGKDIYPKILENWDTQDDNLYNSLINEFCDFHIKNSSEEDDDDIGFLEINPADIFIFPLEILFWQLIRKDKGLTYKANHELLNLELNHIPTGVKELPTIDLLEQCKKKFINDNRQYIGDVFLEKNNFIPKD